MEKNTTSSSSSSQRNKKRRRKSSKDTNPPKADSNLKRRNINPKQSLDKMEDETLQFIDKMHQEVMQASLTTDTANINPAESSADKKEPSPHTDKMEKNMEPDIPRMGDKMLEMMNKVLNDITLMKQEIKEELNDIKEGLSFRDKQCQEALERSSVAIKETRELQEKVKLVESELQVEKKKRIKLEMELRSRNLIFYMIPEVKNNNNEPEKENCVATMTNLLVDTFNLEDINLDTAYRIGKAYRKTQGTIKSRPMMVKFVSKRDRERVWQKRSLLKGRKIIMKEDFPEEMEQNILQLTPILKAAREQDLQANLYKDNLYINGNRFTVENLDKLPTSLQPDALACKETEDHIFFCGKNSWLSNFNMDYRFMIGNISFSSIEQFYCFKKAQHFDDRMAAQKILNSNNPIEQKRTRIAGYNDSEWSKVSEPIMKEGLIMKYSQNESLMAKLRGTKNKMLCEANAHDKFWGIGKSIRDKNLMDVKSWGRNKLGKLLMEIRDELPL
jgi:hypothetical protein